MTEIAEGLSILNLNMIDLLIAASHIETERIESLSSNKIYLEKKIDTTRRMDNTKILKVCLNSIILWGEHSDN